MQMKKSLLLIMAAVFFISANAQETSEGTIRMTLEDCLDYAFENNYSRQSVKLNEESKQDLYNQSKLERLPNLTASLSENLNYTKGNSASWDGSYGLNTSVTLYQGGNISNTIEKNRLTATQSVYETQQYDNELTIQILQAFLTALSNEELLRYQEVILHSSEEQAKQGEIKFREGQILESDYLLLNAQYETDKNNIVESKINRDNSLAALKSLLSINPSQPFEIIFPDQDAVDLMSLMPSENDVIERSMNSLPDLQISKYNVEIAETGLKISKSGYYPTLSLNAGLGSGHNDFSNYGTQISDRFNTQVGLTLSIPIFDRGRTKSNVTQSRIALQQAEYNQKQTELNIQQTLLQEYRNVISAESKYKASTVSQEAYLQSFEAYRAKFEAGAITPVDLLQQQNNYIGAMNEYIRNKYSFMLYRKILDVYMGEKISM